MNFYKHHIGDYAQATAHLSFVEDAAYSRMIRKYYAEEKPLPLEVKAVQRLIGARTKEEKQAVEDVLLEFFSKEDDGWHNKRCDAEIEVNHELDADREAKNANEKERQRRHREERAKLFEALRGLNIVPSYDTKTETLRTLLSNALVTPPVTRDDIDMSQPVTPPVTRIATANQTPDTRLQTPDLKAESTPLPAKPAKFDPASLPIPDGLILTKWGEWIAYRRGRKLTTAEPTMRKQLEFLTQCQARGQPADAVIDASIANGWQGLFELKGAGNGKNGSSRADRISHTIAELTGANRDPSRVIDGTAARVD